MWLLPSSSMSQQSRSLSRSMVRPRWTRDLAPLVDSPSRRPISFWVRPSSSVRVTSRCTRSATVTSVIVDDGVVADPV